MLALTRLPQAEDDLIQIWQYIAEDSEMAADRLLDRFSDVAQKLAAHPEAGRLRPELADDVRSFVVGNCVLFYKTTSTELAIIRVLSRYLDIGEDDLHSE